MADTLAVLGQQSPAATTAATLCTGTTNGTTVSSLFVCNTNSASITFRIWVRIAAAADSASTQALYYDVTVQANDTFVATTGITLASTDNIRVYASTTGVVFTAFGVNT